MQALFPSCEVQGLALAAAGLAWWAGQGSIKRETPQSLPAAAFFAVDGPG